MEVSFVCLTFALHLKLTIMKLTAENVNNVLMSCLFKDGESTDNNIVGECVRKRIGFHPTRLEMARKDVIGMLNCLPDTFRKSGGGGGSFLNMCENKDGEHWGEHESMDQLVALGNALGLLSFLMPRDLWGSLPGSMPYIVIE